MLMLIDEEYIKHISIHYSKSFAMHTSNKLKVSAILNAVLMNHLPDHFLFILYF